MQSKSQQRRSLHQFQALHVQKPLPQGWHAEWSSHHGCFYFIDPTGKRTWIDPREHHTPPVATEMRRSTHDDLRGAMGQIQFADSRAGSARPIRDSVVTYPPPSLRHPKEPESATSSLPTRHTAATGPPIPPTPYSSEVAQKPVTGSPEGHTTSRRFCGCFPTRRSCCTFWLVTTLLLLAGLGVAAYFLWPRMPTVTVGTPYFLSTVGPVQVVSSQLVLNMAVDVNVWSPNYEDIWVDQIVFQGYLIDPSTGGTIETAPANGATRAINFRAKKDTAFTLPFTITHPVDASSAFQILAGTDEAVHAIVAACNGSGSGQISMAYRIQISVRAISWTGFKPSTSGKAMVPCPITASELANLIG